MRLVMEYTTGGEWDSQEHIQTIDYSSKEEFLEDLELYFYEQVDKLCKQMEILNAIGNKVKESGSLYHKQNQKYQKEEERFNKGKIKNKTYDKVKQRKLESLQLKWRQLRDKQVMEEDLLKYLYYMNLDGNSIHIDACSFIPSSSYKYGCNIPLVKKREFCKPCLATLDEWFSSNKNIK